MLLAWLLCYSGFGALCLAMDRHHRDLLGRPALPWVRRVLRWAGVSLLGLSLWVAIVVAGVALGLVQWCAVLMGSALLLVWGLAYRPRVAVGMAGLSVLASPLAAFAALS